MKKLLLTMLGVLLVLPALAHDFQYEYAGQTITYTVIDEDEKTVAVAAKNQVSGELTIPSMSLDGDVEYSVTTIGDYAFSKCSLTSVVIPNSVTYIGTSAFCKCKDLTSVEIPNSVTYIGYSAFENCTSLTSVVIPNSVTYIGGNAFYYCSSLTSVEIPNSVTYIGNQAFSYCKDLTSVEIPNSVTYIGTWAFSYCKDLTSVEIPNSVTEIGYEAFSGCSSLTSINVGLENPNYSSANGVLFSKDYSVLIQYPGGKIGEYVIPNSVTYIGDSAFSGCSLTSVVIPNSVTTIGHSAFVWCSLTSVVIPNSVTYIKDSAFFRCWYLTSVEIPNSVTYIGNQAFLDCTSLTSVFYNTMGPIEADITIFGSSGYSNATLYVPDSAVETFKQTQPWSNFRNIQGYDFTSGIEDVTTGFDETLPCEYFNLSGVKAANSREDLAPGIYIMRQGNTIRKIAVK